MSTIPGYFDYPFRRPGIDHDRYQHRYLIDAPKVAWPGGAPIALWITVNAHHYPMDMPKVPIAAVGGMERIYPDMWNYTLRDYGNRVGIYRIMKILDRFGLTASVPMSAKTAARYPALVEQIVKRDWEIVASGLDMSKLHYEGMADEAALVEESFATLRSASGQAVTGWHSPEYSESKNTPELIRKAGATWLADWANDDMPYRFETAEGPLTALPANFETADKRVLYVQNQSLAAWEHQSIAAFECLLAEGEAGTPRIFQIALTPWVIGQPYRIQALARLLEHVTARTTVWNANGADIAAAAAKTF